MNDLCNGLRGQVLQRLSPHSTYIVLNGFSPQNCARKFSFPQYLTGPWFSLPFPIGPCYVIQPCLHLLALRLLLIMFCPPLASLSVKPHVHYFLCSLALAPPLRVFVLGPWCRPNKLLRIPSKESLLPLYLWRRSRLCE